jgi:hypothetical protein
MGVLARITPSRLHRFTANFGNPASDDEYHYRNVTLDVDTDIENGDMVIHVRQIGDTHAETAEAHITFDNQLRVIRMTRFDS